MIPKGKGIYGRSRFLDEKYAKFLSQHDIEWYVPISPVRLQKQIDAGKKYGINVHAGYIPHSNSSEKAALDALAKLTEVCNKAQGVASIHLDMEEGVFWRKTFCEKFLIRARSLYTGTIGVTCYGSHKGKLAGMQGADYYLDQVYDRGKIETLNQLAMFEHSMEKFKIQNLEPIALGLGAFLNYKETVTKVTCIKPLERFRRHIASCPKTFAVAFWTLPSFQTNPGMCKEHWKTITEWELR